MALGTAAKPRRRRSRAVIGSVAVVASRLICNSASAVTIDGVLAVSQDQPQIHFYMSTLTSADPIIYDDGLGDTAYDVQAYLDTGSSGILLSQETASAFNINPTLTSAGVPVTYYDTGVAGGAGFGVSGQYRLSTAPLLGYANDVLAGGDPPTLDQYSAPSAPIRMQISNTAADDVIGPLDIVGTPIFTGNVMVLDARPLNALVQGLDTGDSLHTYLYPRGTAFKPDTIDTDPGIPTVDRHIRLSLTSFDRFTLVDPAGSLGPTLSQNPMIGPDPVMKLEGKTQVNAPPPVVLTMGANSSAGSFLFDSGAQASFISDAEAAAVGVHYQAGTEGSDDPILVNNQGVPLPGQFNLSIGGIGGSVSVAGFYLDSLTLPTVEGDPITFLHAPVLVTDVTLQDPVTGQTLTLDGDFGMNFLVASTTADLNGSSLGPFDWITYDQTAGILGLQLSSAYTPIDVVAGQIYHFTANPVPGIQITTVGPVTIEAGGKVIVDFATDHGSRTLLAPNGALTIAGSAGHWSGLLDLTNNDLDLSANTLAQVIDQVRQGYNGGKWNGSGGITSSTAAADSTHLTALGVIQNDQNGSPIYNENNLFDGGEPNPGDILIKFTYVGDANLDGIVDGSDYSLIDNGILTHATGWLNGDFNYDGVVNGADYTLIDNAFNRQRGSLGSITQAATLTAQVASADIAVPEPATLGAIALAPAVLLRRRNRQAICA